MVVYRQTDASGYHLEKSTGGIITPYIPQKDRPVVLETLKPETVGELNFLITRICMGFLGRKGKSYANMSAIRGVLIDVGDEFYRRVVVPYENEKMKENGDVY